MKNRMTVSDTAEALCEAWFVRRDLEGVLTYLSEDVDFVGTGCGETALGKPEMTEYIRRDILEIPEPFEVTISPIHQHMLCDHVCSLSTALGLKNHLYTWNLRVIFVMSLENGRWLVRSIHISEPGKNQREEEHYPRTLIMENLYQQRQKMMNDSVPGGMIGGYLEKGFLFLFYQSPYVGIFGI